MCTSSMLKRRLYHHAAKMNGLNSNIVKVENRKRTDIVQDCRYGIFMEGRHVVLIRVRLNLSLGHISITDSLFGPEDTKFIQSLYSYLYNTDTWGCDVVSVWTGFDCNYILLMLVKNFRNSVV